MDAEATLRDLPRTVASVFVSREPVRSPVTPHLMRAVTQFVGMDPDCRGSLSLRFGRGFLLASGRLATVGDGHVAEVVDFDPVKGVALLIGMEEPSDVPLHWLVYRTFPNAGAAVHLSLQPLDDAPPVGRDRPAGSFLEALDAVAALRNQPVVRTRTGYLLTGKDLVDCVRRFQPGQSGRAP